MVRLKLWGNNDNLALAGHSPTFAKIRYLGQGTLHGGPPRLVAWRDNSPKFGLWQNLSMAKVRYRICIVATWRQAVKELSEFMMTSHGWPLQHQRVLGRRMGDPSANGNFLVGHAGA
jgi:hypothetical protein